MQLFFFHDYSLNKLPQGVIMEAVAMFIISAGSFPYSFSGHPSCPLWLVAISHSLTWTELETFPSFCWKLDETWQFKVWSLLIPKSTNWGENAIFYQSCPPKGYVYLIRQLLVPSYLHPSNSIGFRIWFRTALLTSYFLQKHFFYSTSHNLREDPMLYFSG